MLYHIVITTAPEAYDYGSTMVYDRESIEFLGRPCRVVFVKHDTLRDQIDRYLSGSYLAATLESIAPMDYRWVYDGRVLS